MSGLTSKIELQEDPSSTLKIDLTCMEDEQIINWLLEGDVSIQYQTYRDLLNKDKKDLQERIAKEGWGAGFLKKRGANGYWGTQFYQPKWTSTHYTLLDLKNLCVSPKNPLIRESISLILNKEKGKDGGIGHSSTYGNSDVCVNGMFLNYAAYFESDENKLKTIVDFLIDQEMNDGGFNCQLNRSGAEHSSLHSTLSVIEGITEYEKQGYTYRLSELKDAKNSSLAFIFLHQLFISDRTGEIINKGFLRTPYPCRWRYDILRAMDHFQYAKIPWDDRMKKSIDVLMAKRNKNLTWNVQAKYSGLIHFEMEKAGKPSRWNTLRMLRVLKCYKKHIDGLLH